ncbi:hypothetical protein D3C77_680150 [compost metagenome]
MLHRSFDIPDKNLTVVVATGNLVELLPVDAHPMLLFDVSQCLCILYHFPGVCGDAMLLEFEFARTANNSFQVIK